MEFLHMPKELKGLGFRVEYIVEYNNSGRTLLRLWIMLWLWYLKYTIFQSGLIGVA
jgi:hypothetical protein